MVYHMTIAGLERDLPVCKVSDSLYIGAFVIFGDQELTVAAARELLKKAPPYDYLITAEAKGIPLVHEMARQNGDKKYMLARKGPKLYMTGVFDVAVHSITTAKEQHLYLTPQTPPSWPVSASSLWTMSSPQGSLCPPWKPWWKRPVATS